MRAPPETSVRRRPRQSATNSSPTRSTSSASPASGRGLPTGWFDERAAGQLRAGRLTDTSQGECFSPTEATTSGEQSPALPSPGPQRKCRLKSGGQTSRIALSWTSSWPAAPSGTLPMARKRAQAIAENTNAAAQEAEVLVSRLRAKLDQAEIEASRLEQEHHRGRTELETANPTGQVVAR